MIGAKKKKLMSNVQCYYPSGDGALDSTPCLSGAVSFCCPEGYTCLANKLCLPPESAFGNATFLEGTCTDLTFLSPECPSHCAGRFRFSCYILRELTICTANQDDESGPIEIEQCGNDPDVYCCGSCQNCSARNGSFVTIFGVSTASTIAIETNTEVLATVTVLKTAQTTSTVRRTISVGAIQSHLSSTAASTMAKATSPSISNPSSTNLSAVSSTNQTNIAAIATGVTVPVVVIIAGILLWSFFWRRSRKTSHAEADNYKRDRFAPNDSSSKNWSTRNWPNTLQELPGDSGASEMEQNSISKSELPTAETFTLSPLSTKFPATSSPSSLKRDDIISLLSAGDTKRRYTHELPG